MTNYRQFYKDYYQIEFGKEYEVHHIDGNRENNDISNLILLPRELHRKYHNSLEAVTHLFEFVPELSYTYFDVAGHNEYVLGKQKEHNDILSQCQRWVFYKLYLDGVMPEAPICGLDTKGIKYVHYTDTKE